MKIEYISDCNFYLYLNKYYLFGLELDNKQHVENYFKKIFINLKNNYHLDIYGYYNIRVYANKQYGLIIDVFKLSNDYFKMPGNKVDMKIIIDSDNQFLYEVDDYFFALTYKNDIKTIYYKDKKYYLELKDEVDDAFYLYLIEHSNIIFNDSAYEIMSSSLKLL
jgi:hypothetical protein